MLRVVGRAWSTLQHMDPRVLDGLLAIGLSIGAAMQFLAEQPGNVKPLLPITGTCLPLALRRRWPIVAHSVQVASAIASQRQPVTISLLAIFIGVYSVAVYSRWRRFYPVWLVIGSAALALLVPESSPSVP